MDPARTIRLLKSRRAKIVATIGPASADAGILRQLVRAGVSVFRLNMSHGDHGGHRTACERVRAAANAESVPAAVMVDLSGTKIRAGEVRDGSMPLEGGTEVTVTTREVEGQPGLIPCGYRELAADVSPGDRILLDDGQLALEVLETDERSEVRCRVTQGGNLRSRVGMHLPGVHLSAPALTDKDLEDIAFAAEIGADLVALSFVRRAEDIRELRESLQSEGSKAEVLAKIETAEALQDIEAILEASGGILVARGDLGVELEPERLPVIQNRLVDLAREHARPVIVATQMLESMKRNARPTRAEVSDVAQAVDQGTDALMLSGETAIGEHPLASVAMMDKVARQTEGYLFEQHAFSNLARGPRKQPPLPVSDAVAEATARLSRDLRVRCILVLSHSGATASMVASARPAAPVVALTADETTCRQMNLLWGVVPLVVTEEELEEPEPIACRIAVELELAEEGDHLLLVRGFHPDPERNAPTVTVLEL